MGAWESFVDCVQENWIMEERSMPKIITSPLGTFQGYNALLIQIIKFFETGKSPVDNLDTLEIYAFMEAADESKRKGGMAVSIESVFQKT